MRSRDVGGLEHIRFFAQPVAISPHRVPEPLTRAHAAVECRLNGALKHWQLSRLMHGHGIVCESIGRQIDAIDRLLCDEVLGQFRTLVMGGIIQPIVNTMTAEMRKRMKRRSLMMPTARCNGYVIHAASSIIRSNCFVDVLESPRLVVFMPIRN